VASLLVDTGLSVAWPQAAAASWVDERWRFEREALKGRRMSATDDRTRPNWRSERRDQCGGVFRAWLEDGIWLRCV